MSELLDDLTARLTQAVATHGIPGASLAVWDGERMHTAVAGVRNSVTGDPVTVDTLMHIGSITKIFNATLVMQLVDDELINLDDPVVKYLPDLRLRDGEALRRITCKMLLNHTSGINGMALPDHGPDQERIEDFIARCADLGQLHPPGEGPSYCNAAVNIAGYLVQRLRNASWYTLVKERILTPLGLTHSLVDLAELPLFRVSVGDITHPATGKLVRTTRPFLPLSFAPAGATMMTTARDLVEFTRAHLNGGVGGNGTRILSEASARLMQQRTADAVAPVEWGWGLGWMLFPGNVIGHGGGGPGVLSMLYVHPASGRAVALLTNCDQGAKLHPAILDPITAEWTAGAAKGLAMSTPDPTPEHSQAIRVDPQRYVGSYRNNMVTIDVVAMGDGIGVSVTYGASLYDGQATTPPPPQAIRALSNDIFENIPPVIMGTIIRFVNPDADGRFQALGNHVHLFYRRGSGEGRVGATASDAAAVDAIAAGTDSIGPAVRR